MARSNKNKRLIIVGTKSDIAINGMKARVAEFCDDLNLEYILTDNQSNIDELILKICKNCCLEALSDGVANIGTFDRKARAM